MSLGSWLRSPDRVIASPAGVSGLEDQITLLVGPTNTVTSRLHTVLVCGADRKQLAVAMTQARIRHRDFGIPSL